MVKPICVILILFSFLQISAQEFVLVQNKNTKAKIIIPGEQNLEEIAELFNHWQQKLTGVKHKVSVTRAGVALKTTGNISRHIFFKLNKQLNEDAFAISASDNGLQFEASSVRGLKYAVTGFFEKYGGIRYFAKDAVQIPVKNNFSIPYMHWSDQAVFDFRVPYYSEAANQEYIDWHRLSAAAKSSGAASWPVSTEWGLWVHTLHTLVPPEQYFETHPEYFALRNGVRMKDQLCLTNADVIKIVISNLTKKIEENPAARYWSVSQMDNFNYCTCDACSHLDSVERSPSGSMIAFVNKVAASFPEKVISTLAYQYTRKAPANIKPADNVNIMLCTIEVNRDEPIASDTTNGSFYDDMKSWAAVTDNILIWDYVINFSHLLMPFPNMKVLAPNLQFFDKFGADMVFEQGLRGTESGEFNELRCYVLSKLLWNPYQSTDSLINEFVAGYYGDPAAPYILDYITKMEQELMTSGNRLTLYEPPFAHAAGYLSPANMKYYFELLDKASKASGSNIIALHRIEMIRQSLRYAWLEVTKSMPFTQDWIFTTEAPHILKPEAMEMLDELVSTALQYGPELFHEISLPPSFYRERMIKYFDEAIIDHKAVKAKVRYNEKYNDKYAANGNTTLVDGVKGTEAYQMLWQGWWGRDLDVTIELDTVVQLTMVKVGFLEDNQSWIMGPMQMEVSVSDDGVSFAKVAKGVNLNAGKQLDKGTGLLLAHLPDGTHGKYVRVVMRNLGDMPLWRGVAGKAWLFCDEIEVY